MSQETIQNREPIYGNFAKRARIAIGIKNAMHIAQGWSQLSDAQKQSLDSIADKISRILNGDGNHLDSWHDIAGYAQLVEQDIKRVEVHNRNEELFVLSEADVSIKLPVKSGCRYYGDSCYDPQCGCEKSGHKISVSRAQPVITDNVKIEIRPAKEGEFSMPDGNFVPAGVLVEVTEHAPRKLLDDPTYIESLRAE